MIVSLLFTDDDNDILLASSINGLWKGGGGVGAELRHSEEAQSTAAAPWRREVLWPPDQDASP